MLERFKKLTEKPFNLDDWKKEISQASVEELAELSRQINLFLLYDSIKNAEGVRSNN